MPLIKICGIRSPDIAEYAIQKGAQYIGMVFHPASKRNVTLTEAKEIASATRAAGGYPVAVVVDQTAEEISKIAVTTGINIIQLHGETAQQQAYLLPKEWQKIYVCTVSANGEIQNTPRVELNPEYDFLLFDGMQAGSGKTFAWHNFNYNGNMRWFLSGGLTPANVQLALTQLHPHGVDVSSGVEDNNGSKNPKLIQEFIERVIL